MKKGFRRVLATASALSLTGALALAASPVQASTMNQRIETLEKEILRLKAEQVETREQSLAAAKKMPKIKYKPGGGLTISGASGEYALTLGNRLTMYWTFWNDSQPKQSTANGVPQVRRYRPYMTTKVDKGFYDLRFTIDAANGGSSDQGDAFVFDADMYIHFEKMNRMLPTFAFGASPSATVNPQNENCSSKRCGRSESDFLSNGTGVITGGPDRGIGLVWKKLPNMGPMKIKYLNLFVSHDRVGGNGQFASISGTAINTDGRAFTSGIGIMPFAKGGSKMMRSVYVSLGYIHQQPYDREGGDNAWNVRTNQTRAQRISMIRTSSLGMAGGFDYTTVGLGFKAGSMTVRAAGIWAEHQICSEDPSGNCNEGDGVKGRGVRVLGEMFVYSPKGWMTGSTKKGGVMLSPMYQRTDVQQSGSTDLRGCGTGCRSAHAVNSGVALWYYVPGGFMNVGVVWDHWACANCNSDIAKAVPGAAAGDNADWDTVTLVSRFQF